MYHKSTFGLDSFGIITKAYIQPTISKNNERKETLRFFVQNQKNQDSNSFFTFSIFFLSCIIIKLFLFLLKYYFSVPFAFSCFFSCIFQVLVSFFSSILPVELCFSVTFQEFVSSIFQVLDSSIFQVFVST